MSAQRVKSCPWFPGAGSHASPEPRAQPGTRRCRRQQVQTVASPRLETRHLLQSRQGRAGAAAHGPPSPVPSQTSSMIQKSRPALLQPQDVGDRMETLMVTCGEGKAEGPGLPAQGGCQGSAALVDPFPRPGCVQIGGAWGGRRREERRGLQLGTHDQRSRRCREWYLGRDERNCRGLGGGTGRGGGGRGMCTGGPKRGASATGRRLELGAWSDRGGGQWAVIWTISRPSRRRWHRCGRREGHLRVSSPQLAGKGCGRPAPRGHAPGRPDWLPRLGHRVPIGGDGGGAAASSSGLEIYRIYN